MKNNLTFKAAIVAAASLLTCFAQAVPVEELSISSYVQPEGLYVPFSENSAGPSISTGLLTATSAHATASLDGSVTYGFISGSESVSATQGRATADFFGVWQDGLTVESSTLAQNTPVELLATITYNVHTLCNGGFAPTVGATVALNVGLAPQMLVSTSTCNSGLVGSRQEIVQTFVGAVLQLEGQLVLGVTDGAGGSAGIDPPTVFNIDPIGTGFRYTTLSGTNYATTVSPVPEGSTLSLLGVGFGCMALAGSIRRRRRGQDGRFSFGRLRHNALSVVA